MTWRVLIARGRHTDWVRLFSSDVAVCSDHVPEQGFRGTYAPKSLFGSHVVAGSRRTGEAVPVQAGQAGCAGAGVVPL